MTSAISFGNASAGFQAGIINGQVNTSPPGKFQGSKLTPPNPSVAIPFSRDTDFVERGTILDQIYQKCAVSGSRNGLVGLGGVGKSQLAIEFADRTRDRSPETWVFWVHASNAARFEQSFQDIANSVKISGRQNPQANIFQLVHDWLRSDRKGKWVLILDNVDDAGFLAKAQSTGQDGHTNSRGTEKLNRWTGQTGWHNDVEDFVELATILEFMLLAIVQAAAYISQRAPCYSVRQYLQDFRRSNRKRTSLLNCDGEQLRRDLEAKNSFIITWQISFNHICETRPSAADLLSLMSIFDRQGIPEALLRRNSWHNQKENDNKNHTDIDSGVDNGFEDDLLALRNCSFISANIDGTTFEMHGLVQLATREWLKASKQHEQWKQQFTKNLDAEFPTGKYENWVKCQALFPHAQSAIAQQPQPDEHDALRDWVSILYKAAWYAWQMGKGIEAEKMSVQAMKVREKILGQEHNDTLSSMAMLGLAYKLIGQWDTAEELFVQVMETCKKKLGPDHPDTLASMTNLASTYLNQGRWDAAEELKVQVIETSKKKLGADHLSTLVSMANLASTFWNQGQWNAAEELEVQVMETRKKKLGADHPDTLNSMNNLAVTYKNQGRWDAAEELDVQVMETCKKKLGADHPDINSMNNLAFTWKGTGKETEAVRLMEECVHVWKRVLGVNHPKTKSSCRALATWKAEQGNNVWC